MAKRNPQSAIRNPQLKRLVPLLLDWFSRNARDLPWRRTRDPYAIWVSEIMLQQTQVKTVVPYWERWMRELPTIEAVARASPARIHKLWEGLGYYTRVRNLQKAAKQIVANQRAEFHDAQHDGVSRSSGLRFPDKFDDVLALPGIGRYTAGAICSIAFDQPTPILDGNVIRVLTRIFGIAENPKEKKTNARLWKLAAELVAHASRITHHASRYSSRARTKDEDDWTCSHLNPSLMELGAVVCTPRNPRCRICPVKKLCVAFREDRVAALPNLGRRRKTIARRTTAFVVERKGRFLVRQRPAGVVNAHLWEFPNVEVNGKEINAKEIFKSEFGRGPRELTPLCTIKHSIMSYRITLEAFRVTIGARSSSTPNLANAKSGTRGTRPSGKPAEAIGVWKSPRQMRQLAFTAAHKKLATLAANRIFSCR
jgi:A/G-specific adenine glycosylase